MGHLCTLEASKGRKVVSDCRHKWHCKHKQVWGRDWTPGGGERAGWGHQLPTPGPSLTVSGCHLSPELPGGGSAAIRMAQVVMLRTGPLGFLLGSFVCLRGGQIVFPPLATEGEHLAKYRGDDCKVSCLGSGLGFRWDHWAKVGVGTKGFVREGRASPGRWALKGRVCSAPVGSPNPCSGWRWPAESNDPQTLLPTEEPFVQG